MLWPMGEKYGSYSMPHLEVTMKNWALFCSAVFPMANIALRRSLVLDRGHFISRVVDWRLNTVWHWLEFGNVNLAILTDLNLTVKGGACLMNTQKINSVFARDWKLVRKLLLEAIIMGIRVGSKTSLSKMVACNNVEGKWQTKEPTALDIRVATQLVHVSHTRIMHPWGMELSSSLCLGLVDTPRAVGLGVTSRRSIKIQIVAYCACLFTLSEEQHCSA